MAAGFSQYCVMPIVARRYNIGVNCLACGHTDAPASREHVFSAWLLREFDPNIAMGLFRLNPDGTNHKVRKEIKLDGFRLKGVCEPCNNGWMSQLEEQAKPIILDLVRDRRKLDMLERDERTSLARWAAKTAIIESHSVGAECPIDSKHLRWLRKCDDPGRVIVAACKTQWLGFGHVQVGVIRDLIGGGTASGSIILIAIPKLVLACAFPMLDIPYQARCVKSLYAPIWPDPRDWHEMKQTAMPETFDPGEMLAAMAERIEIFQSVV